jgi:hypothetical protein
VAPATTIFFMSFTPGLLLLAGLIWGLAYA